MMASTAQEALLTIKGKGMTATAPAGQPVWKGLTQSDENTVGRSLQDLKAETYQSATNFCNHLGEQVAQMVCAATQESTDDKKALEEEQGRRQRMEDEIKDLVENFEDFSIREMKARLTAMTGDEDIPYPEQIKRQPPKLPDVQPFVHASTQTDDEGGPVDRDLSDECPNRVKAVEENPLKHKIAAAGPRRYSLPPVLPPSPLTTSSSDTSLLDGPNQTSRLPPLQLSRQESTSTSNVSNISSPVGKAKVKKNEGRHAKKPGRRGHK